MGVIVEKTFFLLVQPPLVLLPASATLPTGSVGVAYPLTGFSVTGGTAPYTFAILQGILPAGLALVPSTGAITGMPQAVGNFVFVISVSDSLGYANVMSYTAVILNPLVLAPPSLPNGVQGSPYSQQLTRTGGFAPYSTAVIAGSLPPGLSLNTATGLLNGTPASQGAFNFTVQLSDSAGSPVVSRAYSFTILPPLVLSPATLPLGTLTLPYSVTFTGSGGQAPSSISLASGSLPSGLAYNSSTATISGTPAQTGIFPITISLFDNLQNSVSRTYNLQVTAPFTISPSALPNLIMGTSYSQQLTSTGGAGTLTWSVSAGLLPAGSVLNAATGLISGTPTTVGAYSFTVQVADSVGTPPGSRPYTGTVIAPLQFVTTSLPAGTQGIFYSTILVSSGGLAPIAWSLEDSTLPPGLALNTSTGAITGTPTSASSASVSFAARDNANQAVFKTLTFKIVSSLAIQTTSLNPVSTNAGYSFQLIANGGQQPYNWSIASGSLPVGLTLSSSGLITGTVTQDTTAAVVFRVTDALGTTDTRSLGINVTTPIPALSITTATLPNGNVGTVYSFPLAASGGQGTYRWSISQGALPDGLTLSVSGLIGGTPGTVGTFTFGVLVADGGTRGSGRLLSITIDPALVPLSITTASLPDVDLSIAYTSSVVAAGGKSPYSFSVASGTLPAGITLDSQGGLGGAATVAGAYPFSIQVQDSVGSKVAKSFSINVLAPLSITTESLKPGNVGAAYQSGVSATGGKLPYKFSIASGSLPAGLSMDDSGAIGGKPTVAGVSRVTVQVNDSSKKTASKAFSITVIDVLTITSTSPLPEVVQNQNYSQTLIAAGGTKPYGWSVTGGSLPVGLSLNSNSGELSGKPTAAVNANFTILVADAQGLTATASFALDVLPMLGITTNQIANGVVGATYSASFAASGGTPQIQWSVSSGALPVGLTLSSGGALTGTPTANGSSTFTIQAADSKTQKDTRSFTIVISLPPVAAVTITGLADTVAPVQQPLLGLNLGTAFPVNLTGTVTLTFVADVGADDPAVQFTSGGRTAPFTLIAGDPNARFGIVPVGVQTGTVAGAITLTVKLLAGTVDVTPTPAPTKTIRIAKAVPVLRTVTVTRNAAGFDITITGYVTSRDITTAQFRFTAASGVIVQTVDFTQQLGAVFNTWFQSAASQPFGSQFTLTQPFTIQGNVLGVTSVAVTMSNSVGTSNSITANIP